MFTAQKDCHNGTSSESYIKRDVQKVFVDPGCTLFLEDYQLNSEFSLYLDANVRWVRWDKEDISLFGLNENDVELALSEAVPGERELLLADVVKSARARAHTPVWKILLCVAIVISLISLIVLFAVPIGVRWVIQLRSRFRKLKELFVSLIPSMAEQINTVLRHLSLPQIPLQRFNMYPNLQAEPVPQDPQAPEPHAPAFH